MSKKLKKIVVMAICIMMVTSSLTTVKAQKSDFQKGIDLLLENGLTYNQIIKIFPKSDLALISHANNVNRKEWICETDESGNIVNRVDLSLAKPCTIAPDSNSASTSGGKLKQTVYIFGLDNKNALISYSFEWLQIPDNRKTDCCALLFDGAKLTSVQSSYYSYRLRNLVNGSVGSAITVNRSATTSANGAAFSFTFAQDTTHAGGIKDHQVVNDYGYISCRTAIKSSYVCIWSEYYHQQGALKLTPSISLKGVSVSLSSNTQMVLMNPNPYLYVNVN